MGHRAWFFRIEDAELWLRDRTEITFTVIEEKNGSDLDDFSDAGIRRSLLGKIVER